MSTICGRTVRTFAEANVGLLEGVSMNAPYPFFWVYLKAVERDQILCTGGGEEMRLFYRRDRLGERARVTIDDPIFGPQSFGVRPFLTDDGKPIGAAQAELSL